MRSTREDLPDLTQIEADEILKLLFGSDHKALIQFINSVFEKSYDVDTAPLSISNSDFIDSKTFDEIYGDRWR